MELHHCGQEATQWCFAQKHTNNNAQGPVRGYLARACTEKLLRGKLTPSVYVRYFFRPTTFLAKIARFWSWVCLVLSWGKCRWRVALPAGNGQSLWWQITYRVSVWQTESTKGNYSPHTIQIHPTTRIRYSVCLFSTFLTDGGYPSARTYLRNQTVKGVLPPSLQN